MAATVIVSPHFDDAVLSCWHLLTGPGDVRVVNVFTGAPPNGTVGWWDRLTGATDSVARVREREVEDREALALTGRDAVGLGLPDGQYRDAELPVDAVVERLRAAVPAGARLTAPVDFDNHVDHALARDAALALAAEGHEVVLYADIPAAMRFGWPEWLTGDARPLDVAALWETRLALAGATDREVAVHELGADERARKVTALACYRTQLPALEHDFRGLSDEDLRHEVLWR